MPPPPPRSPSPFESRDRSSPLQLRDNPTLGPDGAKALGDALAGGAREIVAALANAADEPPPFFDVDLDSSRRGPRGQYMTRSGSLATLGLSRCGVGRANNRSGVFALGRGIARNGPLTSLDLRENELTDWSAEELARVLAATRCRLVDLALGGNPDLRQEWLWRDHLVRPRKSDGEPVPSIATSLETNRRRLEREETPKAARHSSKKHGLLVVDGAPESALDGEWTASSGWYPAAAKRTAIEKRDEEALRAAEVERGRLERDAVAAAGAAAAAAARAAARKPPEGPWLVTAVVSQLSTTLKTRQHRDSSSRRSGGDKEKNERARLAALFRLVDVDDSGAIDGEELRPLLARMGWPGVGQAEAEAILSRLDVDKSGTVEFDELAAWWLEGDGRKLAREKVATSTPAQSYLARTLVLVARRRPRAPPRRAPTARKGRARRGREGGSRRF